MEHILSLSYGKDSLACLGAIEKLGWPLDRIVHAEVWATDTIPADLPPMVEFKAKADKVIKERFGIEVERLRSRYHTMIVFTWFAGKAVEQQKANAPEAFTDGHFREARGAILGLSNTFLKSYQKTLCIMLV